MPETTKNFHRVPVGTKKKGAKIRTISIGKGIKALYDVTNKKIITYLFDVNKYTMQEAKKWIKQHKKSAAHLQIVENLALVQEFAEMYDEAKKDVLDALKG